MMQPREVYHLEESLLFQSWHVWDSHKSPSGAPHWTDLPEALRHRANEVTASLCRAGYGGLSEELSEKILNGRGTTQWFEEAQAREEQVGLLLCTGEKEEEAARPAALKAQAQLCKTCTREQRGRLDSDGLHYKETPARSFKKHGISVLQWVVINTPSTTSWSLKTLAKSLSQTGLLTAFCHCGKPLQPPHKT